MKEINVEDAASWDDEEARLNIEYLTARNRPAEVDRINELRAGLQSDISNMTKAELLAMAEERGIEANESMNKSEIIDKLS